MRLRHITGCEEKIYEYDFVKKDLNFLTNKNNKLLKIELGMGKGDFIIQNALQNENIEFIGVEKYPTIVLKAIEKINTLQTIPSNLHLLCEDVANLKEFFKERTVDTIFLNFSDPWPKKRHEKRRLTSKNFLLIYEKLLKENGKIEFKTDNVDLFNYSLESFQENGWTIVNKTFDLHNDANLNQNNIMTEYESKFSKKGNKICKLIAIKKCASRESNPGQTD